MRIGIDISQICYEGTGVARYVREMTTALVTGGQTHHYVLFAATLRRGHVIEEYYNSLRKHAANVSLVRIPLPPTLLDILWNVVHIVPVEWFTGPIDVFWSSDWTQPPLRDAIGVTTVHDMITFRNPEEMHGTIVAVQKRRLAWIEKECAAIFCDSVATLEDVHTLLHIPRGKLSVVYPGATLGL